AFPGHLAAFRAVTIAAAESGQVDGIVPLAERGLSMLDDVGDATVIALQAGELAWRSANDVETARRLLGFAAHHAASHPVVVAFEQSEGPLQADQYDAEAAEAAAEAAAAEAARAAEEEAARQAAEAEA